MDEFQLLNPDVNRTSKGKQVFKPQQLNKYLTSINEK